MKYSHVNLLKEDGLMDFQRLLTLKKFLTTTQALPPFNFSSLYSFPALKSQYSQLYVHNDIALN